MEAEGEMTNLRYHRQIVLTVPFLQPSVLCLMLISGTCLVCTCFFGKGELPGDWPIVTLAMVAKFCVNITFASIYL